MLDQKIHFTVEWLRALVRKAGAKGLVVGVSGGVDSALAAFLIKQAFPNDSLGVVLPCHSQSRDEEDALKVIEAVDLKHVHVDLTSIHTQLLNDIQRAVSKVGDDYRHAARMTDANLRARLRMSTLYALANQYGYLVVGTDNAAEWYLGYFTKYGDGGVDCVPLANLTKSEVRKWARHVGIPPEIIEKSPSAGLWEGQSDEEELGLSYDVVDRYLERKEVSPEERQKIQVLHRQSEHKRQMPPKPPLF